MITNEQYIERIQNYYRDFGVSPTVKVSWATTVKLRFGKWNTALSIAGVPLNVIRDDSQKETKACLQCGSRTTNPKFCSRSCSAIFTNKFYTKRKKKQSVCISCGSPVSRRSKFCRSCLFPDTTLDDATYKLHHKSSAYALVRTKARAVTKKQNRTTCEICGYSKHVETCHIKAISEFDPKTMISVVNSLDNLLVLCPNCHWEFDHPESP